MQGYAMYFLQGSAKEMGRKRNIQLLTFNLWTHMRTHTLQFFGILYTNSMKSTEYAAKSVCRE